MKRRGRIREGFEEGKKEQGRWFIKDGETRQGSRGTKVLNVRAGEKINACSLMFQFNDTSRAHWWRPFK